MVTRLEERIKQYLREQCVVTSAQAMKAEDLRQLPLRYEAVAGKLLQLCFVVLHVYVRQHLLHSLLCIQGWPWLLP